METTKQHEKCRECGSKENLCYSEVLIKYLREEADFWGESSLTENKQALLRDGNICEECAAHWP
jgi:ribosomal protein L40E